MQTSSRIFSPNRLGLPFVSRNNVAKAQPPSTFLAPSVVHHRHISALSSLLRTAVPSAPPDLDAAPSFDTMTRLTLDTINPNVRAAQYAVRGELATRAEKYRVQLGTPSGANLPFKEVIFANIGNPQQLDQKPITFFRQVLSLLENPSLLEQEDILVGSCGYKPDTFARARRLLADVRSVGTYSQSSGAPSIRESVARFISERDGYPASASDIYLSSGASGAVNTLLTVMCAGPSTGVLVPLPQYPLYTATLSLLNARCVPYYLNEEDDWATNADALRAAMKQARSDGIDVRGIVVINPGNPTGASLSSEAIGDVLELAAQNDLAVIADEVYQTNTFAAEFISFKKKLRQLQETSSKYNKISLASLHSVSKGMVGECGHRAGYFELTGFDYEVSQQILKFVSIMLCAPVIGQCLLECMVNPPREGEPSYELYNQEYNSIKEGLRQRAYALWGAFKKMEGVECPEPMGSMYLFPRITLPATAIAAANKANVAPDEFYCSHLLDATGICVVPGSGFGQKDGTYHFRTTFLAPGSEWVGRIVKFHEQFMEAFKNKTPN